PPSCSLFATQARFQYLASAYVRPLARDPLLGSGIAVQIDDAHDQDAFRRLSVCSARRPNPVTTRQARSASSAADAGARVGAGGAGLGSSAIFLDTVSTSAFFETLPKVDSGKSSMSSSRSGSLNFAISFFARYASRSGSVSDLPSRGITQAHMRSPRSG